MAAPSRFAAGLPAPLWRSASRVGTAPLSLAERIGHQFTFVVLVLAAVPKALTHYRRETGARLVDIIWGSGAIIVGGGTIGVLVFLGLATGSSVGIEAYAALDMVGMGPLTGFISAYATTREMGPMIAAIGFAAQAGCRMTAEIGAMRINEEIDALEANAIQSIPFVVTTRVVAGIASIVPLYVVTLALSYGACAMVVNVVHGQASGTYYHYFETFIQPTDVLFSLLKAVVFVAIVIMIHGYQGYYAQGGPEGVGVASGRAIRASMVCVVAADMVLTVLIWGTSSGIEISG